MESRLNFIFSKNYTAKAETMNEKNFSYRLTTLRMQKNVSAREMSLAIGQNPGYINNIENGKALPSMSSFFLICEYLEITPREFFEFDNKAPHKLDLLITYLKGLSDIQMDSLLNIAKDLSRKEH